MKEDRKNKYMWPADCFTQHGGSGLVLGKKPYMTAFFEAFPKDFGFIRGEGETIDDAEGSAWLKYVSILNCVGHEFDPRGRTDGYGYCKHCPLCKSDVLPNLNKCKVCQEPTKWNRDHKGNWWCRKHSRLAPNDPNESRFWKTNNKHPRKLKKAYKKAFANILVTEKGIKEKITYKGGSLVTYGYEGHRFNMFAKYRILNQSGRKYLKLK